MITLEKICNAIGSAIDKARTPIATIPAVLLVCSAINRPGLSAMSVAANIIRRQAEAGVPVGPAEDGTSNPSEAMEVIRVEEMIKAIKQDMRVQIGIPVGGIVSSGVGESAAGPVHVTVTNVTAVHGDGIGG